MSYIGQTLPADTFQGFVTDTFTGDGTANKTFTLSKTPFNESAILVTIDGVVQEATDDFTVSGTTLTLVGTAPNNSEVNAIHIGGALPIGQAASLDLNGASDKLILDADADTTISADTDDQIDFKAGGTDIMSLTATTVSINDNTTITTDDNTDTLMLTSTDADGTTGPVLNFNRNSGSPADNDNIGFIRATGKNDAGQDVDYTNIYNSIVDASDGTEDGAYEIYNMVGGTLRSKMKMVPTETVFNEDAQNIDFRIESDSGNNLVRFEAYNTSRSSSQGCIGFNSNNNDGNFIEAETAVGNVWSFNITHTNNGSSDELYGMRVYYSQGSPDSSTDFFLVCQDSTTTRLRILSDGDVVNHDNSYGAISDERIKQGIKDASSQWDDIKALKVRNFKQNDDVALYGDKAWEQIGVIAQELEAAGMDKCINQEVLYKADDEEVAIKKTAKEGDVREYKSVKYSVLYMKAIKALQEAMAKIETLETKVKALEDA